ncbi:helix-turn-helix domain-containing protein [Nonomuraea roseoviolacea]|uniref:helix-turn-helix domain-containing protein n=1 Tax=Nonomuraea roseoviolacea TaxID=103837 RepID=UPI0031CEBF79
MIERSRLDVLLAEGKKYGDIAKEVGCSYSTVAHRAGELGLSRRQPDHKEAIPWPLDARHKLAMPAQRLRDLSRLGKGLPVDAYRRVGALRWAQGLVDAGWDVGYDPDAEPSEFCPDGGFYVFDATEPIGETHVGKVLAKATGKPARRRVSW